MGPVLRGAGCAALLAVGPGHTLLRERRSSRETKHRAGRRRRRYRRGGVGCEDPAAGASARPAVGAGAGPLPALRLHHGVPAVCLRGETAGTGAGRPALGGQALPAAVAVRRQGDCKLPFDDHRDLPGHGALKAAPVGRVPGGVDPGAGLPEGLAQGIEPGGRREFRGGCRGGAGRHRAGERRVHPDRGEPAVRARGGPSAGAGGTAGTERGNNVLCRTSDRVVDRSDTRGCSGGHRQASQPDVGTVQRHADDGVDSW